MYKFITKAAVLIICAVHLSSCAFLTHRITRTKELTYVSKEDRSFDSLRHTLDIYAPHNKEKLKEVLLFIHGGNWNSGNKSIYRFFGSRLARKHIVAVIINYRLSPKVQYNAMAKDAAIAVKWVKENIATYGGNPDKIFVSGHSAGGHLAALITIRREYFDSLKIESPIKGAILIDAAGLDMYTYLKEEKHGEGGKYLKTFTSNPVTWKEASPLYHLNFKSPPLLIYRGGKTYPSIIKSNEAFIKALTIYVPQPNYKVQKPKRHIPMIVQYLFTLNPRYKEIKRFMKNPDIRPWN